MTAEAGYRETEEWQALEVAIANLNRWNEREGNETMVVDFTLVVYAVPETPAATGPIGGYRFFGTSPMPHINQGLISQGAGYWDNYGGDCDCGECDE